MENTLLIDQAILEAVQSLDPVTKLNEVKIKAEELLKHKKNSVFDEKDNQFVELNYNLKPEILKETSDSLDTIEFLLKYFTNKNYKNHKNFNKFLLFSNIRELLKNSNIKLGQIEKEAGHLNGYMSRLEKLDNAAEPSMEFIITASKLLKISIDSLAKYDFRSLTETELYLLKVIDKFRLDTMNNKLDWQTESADILNQGISDESYIQHPLFETNDVFFDGKSDYPESHRITTFNSSAYGSTTKIAGDCYNLSLKNYSKIYIMNIEKLTTRWGEIPEFSKEIWLVKCDNKKECLVSEKNTPVLTEAVELLYKEISNYVIRPKLKKDTRVILDGFLRDDFTIDEDCKIPF